MGKVSPSFSYLVTCLNLPALLRSYLDIKLKSSFLHCSISLSSFSNAYKTTGLTSAPDTAVHRRAQILLITLPLKLNRKGKKRFHAVLNHCALSLLEEGLHVYKRCNRRHSLQTNQDSENTVQNKV